MFPKPPCHDCKSNCCKKGASGTRPILMPFEDEGQYETEFMDGLFYVLYDEDGECYYHRPDGTCRIHERRPFECRLYPFVIVPEVVDDGRAEPHYRFHIKLDQGAACREVIENTFDHEWINNYMKASNA